MQWCEMNLIKSGPVYIFQNFNSFGQTYIKNRI